jgi:glycosyltransferase involved in cell wall biosynthesis
MKPHSKKKNPDPKPLVSVGVPVYNGAKYLEECLNSILAQTWSNWECVIVNNSSTDGTEEIARKFTLLDPRFKLVNYKEFVGLVENWNRIYPNISSESVYLKVVQADDWIYPEAIGMMVELMEKYPSAGLCSSYRIDGLKVGCDRLHYYDGPLFSGKELLKRHLREEVDISGSVTTPLFRKSILEKLPTFPKIFVEEEYHIDTRAVYEIMHLADVVFVFRVLSYTRWHETAETNTIAIKYNTFLSGKEHRLYRFKQLYPEFEDEYKKHRQKYAYFMLKERLKGNRKLIEWHEKYLSRKFSLAEYISAAISVNGISYRLKSFFR